MTAASPSARSLEQEGRGEAGQLVDRVVQQRVVPERGSPVRSRGGGRRHGATGVLADQRFVPRRVVPSTAIRNDITTVNRIAGTWAPERVRCRRRCGTCSRT